METSQAGVKQINELKTNKAKIGRKKTNRRRQTRKQASTRHRRNIIEFHLYWLLFIRWKFSNKMWNSIRENQLMRFHNNSPKGLKTMHCNIDINIICRQSFYCQTILATFFFFFFFFHLVELGAQTCHFIFHYAHYSEIWSLFSLNSFTFQTIHRSSETRAISIFWLLFEYNVSNAAAAAAAAILVLYSRSSFDCHKCTDQFSSGE